MPPLLITLSSFNLVPISPDTFTTPEQYLPNGKRKPEVVDSIESWEPPRNSYTLQ